MKKMTKAALLCLALLMLVSLAACKDAVDLFPSSEPGSQASAGNGGGTEDDDLIYPDENDEAFGYLGDTLRTSFFDMRVDSAYTCYEFDGVVPDEGCKLLVAEITLYNYTSYTQPMFFSDFEIWWDGDDSSEENWGYEEYVKHLPLFEEEELEDGYEYYVVSDQQLPTEYDLDIRGTEQGVLLYQVPEESNTYSMIFQEYFSDDTEGALFEVRFSAPLAE